VEPTPSAADEEVNPAGARSGIVPAQQAREEIAMPHASTASLIARRSLAAGLIAAALVAGGCRSTTFTPRGDGFSNDRFTYASTSMSPKTVTLVDTRTDETLWSLDVPVGEKLTIKFEEVIDGENPVYPDVMEWVVQPMQRNSWRGKQSMLVPGSEARLIEMTLRPTPEYPGQLAGMPEPPVIEDEPAEPDPWMGDRPALDEPEADETSVDDNGLPEGG
jgi:hypothetical protein